VGYFVNEVKDGKEALQTLLKTDHLSTPIFGWDAIGINTRLEQLSRETIRGVRRRMLRPRIKKNGMRL
jgi:hypothetical protein